MDRRTYRQCCALACALDVVGERWSLLVVRELLLGPKRYTDMLQGLPGVGTSVLSARLKHLEQATVVRRTYLPPPAASWIYELTERGQELEPAIAGLAKWGVGLLDTPQGHVWRPSWLALFWRLTLDPQRAARVHEAYEFHIDGEVLHIRVGEGTIDVQQGPAPAGADVVVTCDLRTLLSVGLGRIDERTTRDDGLIEVAGDPAAFERCRRLLRDQAGA